MRVKKEENNALTQATESILIKFPIFKIYLITHSQKVENNSYQIG